MWGALEKCFCPFFHFPMGVWHGPAVHLARMKIRTLFLFPLADQGEGEGGVLSMFDNLGVKVPSQPGGGEG